MAVTTDTRSIKIMQRWDSNITFNLSILLSKTLIVFGTQADV